MLFFFLKVIFEYFNTRNPFTNCL